MNVTKCSIYVVPEDNKAFHDSEYAFDQSGKPWRVERFPDNGMIISPVDKELGRVTALYPQQEGYLRYLKSTIADAAAMIEAYDVALDAVNIGPDVLALLEKDGFDFVTKLADSGNPPESGDVFELVTGDVTWGPILLDFRKPATTWPFGGRIPSKNTTFEGLGKHACLFKHDGYSIQVQAKDVLVFATTVASMDFHKAVKAHFPDGVRLISA